MTSLRQIGGFVNEAFGLSEFWTFLATILVMAMVAGLGLIGSGVIRYKNSISILFQTFLAIPIVGLVWLFVGYSMSFGSESLAGIISMPQFTWNQFRDPSELIYIIFQMTFAITATALTLGSVAERIQQRSILLFLVLWPLFVYIPVAHWIWNEDGWIHSTIGGYDFAGGIVVHITAGFSSLVLSNHLGRRKDYFNLRLPSNVGNVYLGIFLVLIGWLGFNGGSALKMNLVAMTAILNTFICAFSGCLTWLLLERLHPPNRINFLGITYGVICALVAITPSCSVVSGGSAFFIGIISCFICFYSVRAMNRMFKVDDPLEVFSSHGIAGLLGALLTGLLFSSDLMGPQTYNHLGGSLALANLVASIIVASYAMIMTYIIIKVIGLISGFRVSEKQEAEGLDIVHHGEKYTNQ
jgi:Amt family ammonium transporter